jgi:putative membrane protein
MITKTDIRISLFNSISYLRPEILFTVCYSSLIYYLYVHHDLTFLAHFDFLPVSYFLTIFSVFLAFRNNSAYSRWWEARQLWGQMVNNSRTLSSKLESLLTTSEQSFQWLSVVKQDIVFRHLTIISLIRLQLRGQLDDINTLPYLSATDKQQITGVANPAAHLIAIQARNIENVASQANLNDFRLISLVDTVCTFQDILGACERIKNTPFPREYDGFIRLLIWAAILVLPIYLLGLFSTDVSKILSIPVAVVIIILFGFANKVGEVMEDPFENRIHDIPMTTLCNTIERDMLQLLPNTEVPAKLHPVDDAIW